MGIIIFVVLFLLALVFGEKVVKESILFDELPKEVARWKTEILNAATQTGVPAPTIAAVIWQESWGDPDAIGSSGEVGLMQVKPDAVTDVNRVFNKDFYVDDLTPYENILVGSYYLKLMRENHSNWDEAHEAYNQGARGRTIEARKPLAIKYRNEVNAKKALIT